MSNDSGKVVCVTGASGYIASWLVKYLLQCGYTVNATVRDPNDPKKTEHLLGLDGAKERLHLFKADLVEEGCFNPAVEGCVGVFHTASPVTASFTDPQVEMIDIAVKGTLNVLKSCAKVKSIKRIVVTSSIATMMYNTRPLTEDVVVDETWYSDTDFCLEQKLWYMISKTLAEDTGRKFAEENGMDIVFINPGIVIGPLLQPTLNLSVEMILALIKGAQIYPVSSYQLVDVRDVADAHIRAFENPSATGRYCFVAKVVPTCDILTILNQFYPTLLLPEKSEDNKGAPGFYRISKEKAESLGIKFMAVEESLRDTVESLKEKKFITI